MMIQESLRFLGLILSFQLLITLVRPHNLLSNYFDIALQLPLPRANS